MERGFFGKKHCSDKTGPIAQVGRDDKRVRVYVVAREIAAQPVPHSRSDAGMETGRMGDATANDDPSRGKR